LFIKKRKTFYMKKILNWRQRLILVYQRKKVFILVMFIRKWYKSTTTTIPFSLTQLSLSSLSLGIIEEDTVKQ